MRRLIINADQLGVNAQRTHGIFQCFEFGVVTSATIVANGSGAYAAARHARERGLPAGLHLNLTEDFPVSKPDDVSSLLGMTGVFLDHEHLSAALADGQIDREHLSREIRAQVEWILDTYGAPTHVAGQEHIHTHPAVIEALLPVLDRYGIRFVRIPCEEPLPPHGYQVSEEQLLKVREINGAAHAARTMYAAHGIESTDHFRGLTLTGNSSLKNMRHVLTRFPETGTMEIMTHPGSMSGYGTPFDLDPQRQTELRMLTDPSIRLLLAEKKVTLCSFADL
ncbi:MAG: ChbG/HpnK family deacetylase [Candidatus Peribacteraceae bacterium]|nr:ChbG/HpnK family deacetylase [Candidatus Peribacteraceae bacterium]MDD5074695.1 ChbG/HpnK family deacetylase [Candidatus Peribacteraceae bacterium]